MTIIGNSDPSSYNVTGNAGLICPYLYLSTNAELADPKIANLPDGTPFFVVNTKSGQKIYNGISPAMTITYPDPDKLTTSRDKEFSKAGLRFASIKEPATLMLYDLFAEEIYKYLVKSNIPTTLTVQNAEGKPVVIEIINTLMYAQLKPMGRLAAALDLGGMIVALKALENTKDIDWIRIDRQFNPVINSLPSIKLGNTPQDLLRSTFDWAINSPLTQGIAYKGNLQTRP